MNATLYGQNRYADAECKYELVPIFSKTAEWI